MCFYFFTFSLVRKRAWHWCPFITKQLSITNFDWRNGRFFSLANLRQLVTKMPVSDSLEAIALRQEAERFESVCPNIQSLYDLLEGIDNVPLKRKIRELVNRIEGEWIFNRWCKQRYNFNISKWSVRLWAFYRSEVSFLLIFYRWVYEVR